MPARRSNDDAELVWPVPEEEIRAWAHADATTFMFDPDSESSVGWAANLSRSWDPSRAWGVRAGRRWVATCRSMARTISLPSGGGRTALIGVDAISSVTVAATHRRRGWMSEMLKASLGAARERGEALSVLITGEWPIYGRFGYAPATLSAEYVLHRSRPGARLIGDPGRLRQVERTELAALAPSVFEAQRQTRAGQIDRDAPWWEERLGLDGFTPQHEMPHVWLVHDGDDRVDGVVGWRAKGKPSLLPPLRSVSATMVSGSAEAYRDSWAYLAGLDGCDEVRLSERPVDEPVRWLLRDARTLVTSRLVDFLWVRLLDIPRALSARGYGCSDELVLEVVDDDHGGFAAGRYRLAAEAGGTSECVTTEAEPDLRISQRALASIFLGGFRLPELSAALDVCEERTPGALARLDLLFASAPAPWNPTWF